MTALDPDSSAVRVSPISGKIATNNLHLLEPYIFRKIEDNKLIQTELEPGDFTPEIIALEWFRGDSSSGKIFNNIVPIYQNGCNIMYTVSRNSFT